MDPATLALLGIGLEAFGSFQSNQAQASALSRDAQTSTQNAMAAVAKSRADAEQQIIQSRYILGEQRAGFAAAGVEGGSVEAVMSDSAINAEMDRLSILFGGDVRSKTFMSEAQAKSQGAKDVSTAGFFGLLSSGFKGASIAAKE
jgi:hypothetical protein